MSKQDRHTGMDLFRLLSMFLVVMIHISGGMPGRVCACLVSISICAVNCFGVLSGYVGFGSKHRVSGLWWLWGQVIWYYLLINCIAICLLPDKVTVIDLWKSFFPVCKVAYWYFTAYFCLFWGMPALDSIIEHLNYKRLRSAIIIFGGLFCLTSFTPFRNLGYFWGSGDGASVAPPGYCATWLGYLYLVGAYFRQYPPPKEYQGTMVSGRLRLLYGSESHLDTALRLGVSLLYGHERYRAIHIANRTPASRLPAFVL